ncbi:MAG TPA: GAF domain-containing protein [Hymenobacter sp.]|jgi:hypothetical protein
MGQARQQVFQEIVRLTSKVFLAPIVLLSLVGLDTVMHASQVGLPGLPDFLSREDCICAGTVYQPGITIFPDLQTSPCPWVRPTPLASGIRFYAGHPLKTAKDQPIGTLCVLDREARSFSAEEQLVLERLAAVAMRLLDLQLVLQDHQREEPAVWRAINNRVALSIQRIETLTALAQWEVSPETEAARAYRTSMHDERILITQDIDYEVGAALARFSTKRMQA